MLTITVSSLLGLLVYRVPSIITHPGEVVQGSAARRPLLHGAQGGQVRRGGALPSSSESATLTGCSPSSSKATSSEASSAGSHRKREPWDWLGLLSNDAFHASLVHPGDPQPLRRAIARVNAEERPLTVGILGGSFSAKLNGFAYVFGNLTTEDTRLGTRHGVRLINLAQGAANLALPLYCLDKLYSILSDPKDPVPDLWIVEPTANWAYEEGYMETVEALLLRVMSWGSPAVILADVMTGRMIDPEWTYWRYQWQRPPILRIAKTLSLPMVSFLDGLVAGLDLPADILLHRCREPESWPCDPGPFDPKLVAHLQWIRGTIVNPDKFHFNPYSSRVMGHFLYESIVALSNGPLEDRAQDVVLEQGDPSTLSFHLPPTLSLRPHSSPPSTPPIHLLHSYPHLRNLSRATLDLFSRFDGDGKTAMCNLTLTHGRGVDLIPTRTDGFELWTQDVTLGEQWVAGPARDDQKAAYKPQRVNATLDFAFNVSPRATDLCLLMYGRWGGRVEVTFPAEGKEGVSDGESGDEGVGVQEAVPRQGAREEVEGEGKGESRRMKAAISSSSSGSSISYSGGGSGVGDGGGGGVGGGGGGGAVTSRQHVDSSRNVHHNCTFFNGHDFSPNMTAYVLTCGCPLPQNLKGQQRGRIRIRSAVGQPQVAGVVIW